MRKAPSGPVLRWKKTTQSDLKITLAAWNTRSFPFWLPPGRCLHVQQSLGSWLPWSQPHAVTPQIKEDPPDGFCKRWNLMNP